MTPREYFQTHYTNIQDVSKIDISTDPLLSGFDYKRFIDVSKYKYSNSVEFEDLVEKFFPNDLYNSYGPVYIGKLANAYPNCYTIKNDDITGCLICITSGLTENSYIIAKLYALQHLFDKTRLKNVEYEAYKKILENDIVRRVHEEYGGQIRPGDELYYAEIILKSELEDFLGAAANFSYVMDLFTIYHEYSHYILGRCHGGTDGYAIALMVKVLDIHFQLCEARPIYRNMPIEEVFADISALLLFSGTGDLEKIDIMAMLLSIVQLRKISSEDIYTNNYRLDLFYYCLSIRSASFIKHEQEIKEEVQEYIDLFDSTDKARNAAELWKMINELLELSDNPEEALVFIAEDRLKMLKRMEADLLGRLHDDDFEDFE